MTIPTIPSEGITLAELNNTPGNEIGVVEYTGFASHGFFRGKIKLKGDLEFTLVFSSAAEDASSEWDRVKFQCALEHAVARALRAEANIRAL